jgi:hypothetical protein
VKVGGSPFAEIDQITVPCLSIEQIMERYTFHGFDCIFMDVEGHEGNILLNMDFAAVRPSLIVYEHIHLGHSRAKITQFLLGRGFQIEECSQDTIAYRHT